MNKKDEEIQQKLLELESVVLKESAPAKEHSLTTTNKQALDVLKAAKASTTEGAQDRTIKQELCFFLGVGCLITGLLMFLNHVHVGAGAMMNMFAGGGGSGFGLLMIPLMAGIGWLIYDVKSRWAWLFTACVLGVIMFSVLASLVLNFPQMSLLGLIMLLLPFAAGGALLLKGVGGPKAIQDKMATKE